LKLLRPFFRAVFRSGRVRQEDLPAGGRNGGSQAQRDGTIGSRVELAGMPSRHGSSLMRAWKPRWTRRMRRTGVTRRIRSGRSLELPCERERGGRCSTAVTWRVGGGHAGIWMVRDGMITGRHSGQKWNDYLRNTRQFSAIRTGAGVPPGGGVGNSAHPVLERAGREAARAFGLSGGHRGRNTGPAVRRKAASPRIGAGTGGGAGTAQRRRLAHLRDSRHRRSTLL